MSEKIPGNAAWKRRDYEMKQVITSDDGTYIKDCEVTQNRYIISQGKVVAQIGADDIEWLRIFSPNLKTFGYYV